MEPLFLEERWYRTNWNYFLTPYGVFVLRLILLNKEWIYFYGFVYDKDNKMHTMVFKSDNEELKRLINAQISKEYNTEITEEQGAQTKDTQNTHLKMLRCTEHTRLLLYNFFCTNNPTANEEETRELKHIVDVILG